MTIKKITLAAALPVAMMVAAPAQAVPNFIIDDYNVTTMISVEDTSTGGPGTGNTGPGSPSNQGIVMNQAGGAAGWDRGLYAELTTGDSVQTIGYHFKTGHPAISVG